MLSLFQIEIFLQVTGLTPARAAILPAAALGIISVVFGCLALARSAGRNGSRKLKSIIALVPALIGIILSVRHLARATGDIGTGGGKLGAIVALVLGLVGIVLGGLALNRSRQIASQSNGS